MGTPGDGSGAASRQARRRCAAQAVTLAERPAGRFRVPCPAGSTSSSPARALTGRGRGAPPGPASPGAWSSRRSSRTAPRWATSSGRGHHRPRRHRDPLRRPRRGRTARSPSARDHRRRRVPGGDHEPGRSSRDRDDRGPWRPAGSPRPQGRATAARRGPGPPATADRAASRPRTEARDASRAAAPRGRAATVRPTARPPRAPHRSPRCPRCRSGPSPSGCKPGRVHRQALMATLPEEQPGRRRAALPGAVCRACARPCKDQNATLAAEGKPEIKPTGIESLAQDLLPRVRVADWLDRADAAQGGGRRARPPRPALGRDGGRRPGRGPRRQHPRSWRPSSAQRSSGARTRSTSSGWPTSPPRSTWAVSCGRCGCPPVRRRPACAFPPELASAARRGDDGRADA